MKLKMIPRAALLGGTIVLFILSGNHAFAQGLPFPTYGSGNIQVRLYTDYFCPPCRGMEPAVEPVLRDLIKRGAIRLTLVDTPYSRHSPLYARYFLYALKEKNELEHALKIRNILFEAASDGNATTKEQVENLLKHKGISYSTFDASSVFNRFNSLIKEDRIQATPTCVIVRSGKKEAFVGKNDIVNALKSLR